MSTSFKIVASGILGILIVVMFGTLGGMVGEIYKVLLPEGKLTGNGIICGLLTGVGISLFFIACLFKDD